MSDCIFCRIAAKEIPSQVVYEDDAVVAFRDINPQAPVHLLVIPRRHIRNVLEVADDSALVGRIHATVARLASEHDLSDRGFRIVVNTGAHGGQSVDHLHYHVLGGRSMQWPPG